jgi:hypothetical protein
MVVKRISLIVALAALALATYIGVELSRTRTLLRLEEERAEKLRPMQTRLLEVTGDIQKAEAEAVRKQAQLEDELRADHKALETAQKRLALVTARLANASAAQNIGKGTYTLDDGTVVYGPGAQLRLANGMVVSSPSGVMVSDSALSHIDGDLQIVYQDRTISVTNGFVSLEDGHVSVKGDQLISIQK